MITRRILQFDMMFVYTKKCLLDIFDVNKRVKCFAFLDFKNYRCLTFTIISLLFDRLILLSSCKFFYIKSALPR